MAQPSFFGTKVLLSFDVADRLVESADFDRLLIVTRASHSYLFGFTEFTTFTGTPLDATQMVPSSESDRLSFVLPAGQELWAGHSASGVDVTLSLLVTKLP